MQGGPGSQVRPSPVRREYCAPLGTCMLSMLSVLNKAGERSPSEGQRCETACQQQGAAAVSSRVVTLAQALKLTKYQPPIKAKLSLTPSGGSRHSTDTDGQVCASIGRRLALNNAS